MLRTLLLFLFWAIGSYTCNAQGETSNWYFGNQAGLQFNNDGSVTPLVDGRLNTFEGCATISDPFGNLILYTDGITVYDGNHNIIENGTGLFGDPSSTQSAIIVPKPEDPNIIYIFTVDTTAFENDPDRGLNYSVVDLSLNAGAGSVIEKNISLLRDCTEKITAVVKDCFDKSVWLITLASVDGNPGPINTYHAFEINPTGVSTTSVKTTFDTLQIVDPRGNLKLSPDGTKLVSANSSSGLYLYDFDAATGILSNQQRLEITSQNKSAYGVEFSPNQDFLYVHASNDAPPAETTGHSSSLIQFDLTAANVINSQEVIDLREIYRGSLQVGQNGKIYRTLASNYFTGTPFLGVINSPNEKGVAADYEHNAVDLLGRNATQGLPPFIQSFFDKATLIENADGTASSTLTLCYGESFVLQVDPIPGATYNWTKDGVSFSNPNPFFQIDSAVLDDAGRYAIEIISSDPFECPITGEAFISINPIPDAPELQLTQCDVDPSESTDGITAFNLEQVIFDDTLSFTFYENLQNLNDDVVIPNPIGYTNTNPFDQIIFYKVIDANGCENSGQLVLRVELTFLSIDQPESLFACDDDPDDLLLQSTFDLKTFEMAHFSNLDVSFYNSLNDLRLEQNALPGEYTTESTTVYARIEESNQCQDVIQLELVVFPTPLLEFEESFIWCTDGPPLEIRGPLGFDTYQWSKKEGNSASMLGTQQLVSISAIGIYTIEVGHSYQMDGQTIICTSSRDFEVLPSNRAVIEDIVIEDISDNNTVQVLVSGDGVYEFSLDGVNYQKDNFFENVLPGFLTVFVRDINNCGISEELISVIGYPKFFTPNGDGANDVWQIIGTNEQFQANSKIAIYDRFGKLLAQLSPGMQGWNGTYNNAQLPASDYWFEVMLEDGRRFKGHFALKR